MGLDPVAALQNNDANSFLAATDDLIIAGPAGTSVADVWLVLGRDPRSI